MLSLTSWRGITPHGFRSTFRDWAREQTSSPEDVQEAALAHTKGGTVGAYARSDLFDKRRALMEAWGRYCTGATEAVRLVAGDKQ